jgi:hypothetical protein
VLHHHADSDGDTWRGAEGTLFISRTVGNVILQKFSGRLTMDFVTHILQTIEPRLAPERPLIGFNDWAGMAGYTTEARVALTKWLFTARGPVAEMHVLVRSKLVAMGVSVANLLLGGFVVPYARPERFKTALAERLGGGTQLLRHIG